MKIGLFINTQFQPGDPVGSHLADLVTETRTARDAGFASLWFPHHYLTGPLQMLQIVPIVAYLAQHADGMQIGPNILILPLLNPVHVAEESATLDVLTGGNYVLGVGLGYREGEFTAFNMTLKERVPRLEESIALMRRLWTEDKVTHKGRFYQVNDHMIGLKPVRAGGPPIWMAGSADAAIRRSTNWWRRCGCTARRWAPAFPTASRSCASVMSAPTTIRRWRNAAPRCNTNTTPMHHGACRRAGSRVSRSLPATGSSSATRCSSRRRSCATAKRSAWTTS
jgi:hypothetical protein